MRRSARVSPIAVPLAAALLVAGLSGCQLFGKKNDYLALNLVGFILSIPIYFGCAYIMTAPLVTALQKISKKSVKVS